MILDTLKAWATARLRPMRRETPQQSRDSARVKREARAQTVTDLQAQVRDLQQQITDLTASDARASLESNRATLAKLEQRLAETQAELGRYQGRI